MKMFEILLVIRARYKILLFTILVAVSTAAAAIVILPKTFKATTTLILNYKGVDPVSGYAMSANLMPGYIATQLDIIHSPALVTQVVDQMRLVDDSRFKQEYQSATNGQVGIRDWLVERISKKLEVASSRQSSLIDLSIKDTDPKFAAALANAFSDAYLKTAIRINSEPQLRVSSYLQQQRGVLRTNLEAARARLSAYQKEKGLVNVDTRYDVESARLNELSSQLVVVQGQLMDAQSRENQALKKNSAKSPDVVANPLIQSLKASLAQAEATMSQVRTRYTPEHPEYQKSKADVEQRRAALAQNTRALAASVGNAANIAAQRERDLRVALEEQKAKVMQANRARDELTVLNREVEGAQRAYDELIQRFNLARIDGQANQSDVAVLNPAAVPARPAYPKPLLDIVLSLLLSGLLGAALVFVVEMLDRRVRSARELSEILNAPVLGIIGPAAARQARVPSLTFSVNHPT